MVLDETEMAAVVAAQQKWLVFLHEPAGLKIFGRRALPPRA